MHALWFCRYFKKVRVPGTTRLKFWVKTQGFRLCLTFPKLFSFYLRQGWRGRVFKIQTLYFESGHKPWSKIQGKTEKKTLEGTEPNEGTYNTNRHKRKPLVSTRNSERAATGTSLNIITSLYSSSSSAHTITLFSRRVETYVHK